MFERYTERARRVLFFARYEASQCGNRSITPEHLLLGLDREGQGIHPRLFKRGGVTPDTLRREIEARLVFEEKISTSTEIPFSDSMKRALQLAALEADRLLHNYIGTEHLLLGVLHEGTSIACQVLNAHGLQLDDVRQQIVILLNEPSPFHAAAGTSNAFGSYGAGDRASVFPQRVDLRSLLAQALHVDPQRIEIPRGFDKPLALSRERRPVEVYVLTSVPGRTFVSQDASDAGGGVSVGSMAFATASAAWQSDSAPSLHSLGPLSMKGATMAELCRTIENAVGRPVVDESGLDGRFDVDVSGSHESVDAFVSALERQAGLTLTPTTRDIEVVIAREP